MVSLLLLVFINFYYYYYLTHFFIFFILWATFFEVHSQLSFFLKIGVNTDNLWGIAVEKQN